MYYDEYKKQLEREKQASAARAEKRRADYAAQAAAVRSAENARLAPIYAGVRKEAEERAVLKKPFISDALFCDAVAFTDVGRGWAREIRKSDGFIRVQLIGEHKDHWLHRDDVRSVEEEIRRRKLQVLAEKLEIERSVSSGHFPDMSHLDLPHDQRSSKGSRQMRNLEQYGGYRPAELPPLFEAYILSIRAQITLKFQWPERVHDRIITVHEAEDVLVPEAVRPMKRGVRVIDAAQAGGPQGYTFMPAPDDLSIIPTAFRPSRRSDGKIRIGNCRLVVGLHKWLDIPISFLTEEAEQSYSFFDDGAATVLQ